MSVTKNISLMGAVIFLVLGLVAGFISDMLLNYLPWEHALLGSSITFGLLFILMVWLGRAKWNFGYLMMFVLVGWVASYISGWLGDMWGFSGAFMGSGLTLIIMVCIVAFLGPKRSGVQTA